MVACSRCALSNASTRRSHLRIRRTFSVENRSLTDGILCLDRREDNSLNTFCINGHGIILRKKGSTSSALFGSRLLKTEESAMGDQGHPKTWPKE